MFGAVRLAPEGLAVPAAGGVVVVACDEIEIAGFVEVAFAHGRFFRFGFPVSEAREAQTGREVADGRGIEDEDGGMGAGVRGFDFHGRDLSVGWIRES